METTEYTFGLVPKAEVPVNIYFRSFIQFHARMLTKTDTDTHKLTGWESIVSNILLSCSLIGIGLGGPAGG